MGYDAPYIRNIIDARKAKRQQLVLRQRDILIQHAVEELKLAEEFLELGDIAEARGMLEEAIKELEGKE